MRGMRTQATPGVLSTLDELKAELLRYEVEPTYDAIAEWLRHRVPASDSAQVLLPTLGDLMGAIDWFNVPAPPIPQLFTYNQVGGVGQVEAVPRGQVMIVAAGGGVGKTQAVIDACLAVATGARWLGIFNVVDQGTAVALLGETSQEVLWCRMQSIWHRMNASSARPLNEQHARNRARLVPMSGRAERLLEMDPKTRGTKRTAAFRSLLSELSKVEDLRLVVVDTLARFGAPECEISPAAATDTIKALETIANLPTRPVVMALHHTSQAARGANHSASTTDVRGGTAITDNARLVWLLNAVGEGELHEYVRLTASKGNDVPNARAPWLLKRGKGGALHVCTPEERDECDRMQRARDEPGKGKANGANARQPQSNGGRSYDY